MLCLKNCHSTKNCYNLSFVRDIYHRKYENNDAFASTSTVIPKCQEIFLFRHGKISVG